MIAIQTESLVKIYKPPIFSKSPEVTALNGLDLTIEHGKIYALLGPNGAGKTTLIRILAGLLPPTSGTAAISGVPVSDQRGVRRKIGLFVASDTGFFRFMTGIENIRYFAALQNMDPDRCDARIKELIGPLGLKKQLHKKLQSMSSGLLQRFLLIRALLHDPEILLLDEPISHLDPFVARELHTMLRNFLVRDLKKTILLTTHQLEEAQEMADTLGFLFQGKMVWQKPAAAFRERREDLLRTYMDTVSGGEG